MAYAPPQRRTLLLVLAYLVEHEVKSEGCTYVAAGEDCYEYGFREGPFDAFFRRHLCSLPAIQSLTIRGVILAVFDVDQFWHFSGDWGGARCAGISFGAGDAERIANR
jgi:hypothetical protein